MTLSYVVNVKIYHLLLFRLASESFGKWCLEKCKKTFAFNLLLWNAGLLMQYLSKICNVQFLSIINWLARNFPLVLTYMHICTPCTWQNGRRFKIQFTMLIFVFWLHQEFNKTKDWALVQTAALVFNKGVEVRLTSVR